jgi:very-short-patch-repair endonuclease
MCLISASLWYNVTSRQGAINTVSGPDQTIQVGGLNSMAKSKIPYRRFRKPSSRDQLSTPGSFDGVQCLTCKVIKQEGAFPSLHTPGATAYDRRICGECATLPAPLLSKTKKRRTEYDPIQRRTVGYQDQRPISPKYLKTVNGNRKRLVKEETASEKVFRLDVAEILRDEYRVSFIAQRVFHVKDQVAFIVDFYFQDFKLAVEIDGHDHYKPRGKERDIWRDGLLLEHAGVRVIRFSNQTTVANPLAVLDRTVAALLAQPNATPSHQRHLARRYRFQTCDPPDWLRAALNYFR